MSDRPSTASPEQDSTSTASSRTAPTALSETGSVPAPAAEASAPGTVFPAGSATPPLPLLIGECPSLRGDQFRDFPLSGGPARVVSQLAGLVHPGGAWYWTLIGAFDTVNVLYRHQPRWSHPKARYAAEQLLAERQPKVVVCLGRRPMAAVCEALDFNAGKLRARKPDSTLFGDFYVWAAPWMIKVPVAGRQREYAPWLVHIPHPSGLNRVLNDPEQRERAGKTLREAISLAADPDPKYPERLRRPRR